MSIEKISDAARDAASVGALADRPQATERDGYSGMTPAQLKAAFDALPKLNTAKINEIIDLINGESTESLAYLLQTPVEYQGNTMTLYEFLAAVQDGRFGDIAMIGDNTLSEAIYLVAGDAFDDKMEEITAEAETLDPDEDATVSYDNTTKKFLFGIPQGEKGDTGGDDNNIVVFRLSEDNLLKTYSGGYASYDDGATTATDIKNAYDDGKSVILDLKYSGNRTPGTISDTQRLFLMDMPDETATNGGRVFGGIGKIDGVAMHIKVACNITNPSSKAQITLTPMDYDRLGKITIGYSVYTPVRKPLAITENGVTTTYYVLDATWADGGDT